MNARASDFSADHGSAGRALICALASGLEPKHLEQLADVFEARLSRRERMGLLACAIRAADVDDAVDVMSAALSDITEGAGQPAPPLIDVDDDAAFWAEMASPAEIEAYCLAAFMEMPRTRQEAFLAFAQRRQAV